MNLPSDVTKEPESVIQVRFQDCDPFGHLNNVRYIDYFLNARMDHLQNFYGVNIYKQEKPMTASWVIKKTQIAYLRPAMLAEEVVIRTRVIHYTDSTIVVEGLMLDKEAKHLKSVVWIEFAYISMATGRPTTHDEDWLHLLRSVSIESNYDADGYNRRAETARLEMKKRVENMIAVSGD